MHIILKVIFHGKQDLAACPLIVLFHLFLNCTYSRDKEKNMRNKMCQNF